MKLISQVWNNFKIQPGLWFFCGFLLTCTLSIRKVLFFYPIGEQFNEWTGAYLYLSDMFIALTLISWACLILQNKYTILSIDSTVLWLKEATVLLPLILIVWSFCSIFWSENQNIALFKAIKLLEFYLLYLYIIFRIIPAGLKLYLSDCHPELDSGSNLDRFRIKPGMTISLVIQIIITLGFIQAIIGIWQFIIQHSIGLFWLKESLISPDINGVAKIVFHGDKFIRSYGLFPHPNILGGFLLISIILTWAYFRMFHPSRNEIVSRLPRETKMFHMEHFNVSWGGTIIKTILAIQILALILTFSKSAILAFIISSGYIWLKNKDLFHVKQIFGKLIIGLIILILGLYLAGLNFGDNLNKSLGDRLGQFEIWKSAIQDCNILFGSGMGSYLFHVEQIFPGLEAWQYQPIHNVYLLILSELGFVELFVFALFLWKIYKTPSPFQGEGWGEVFKGILLGLIFIMLFDHYLWDIQQGQIMLWLILGFLAGLQLQNQFDQSNSKESQK